MVSRETCLSGIHLTMPDNTVARYRKGKQEIVGKRESDILLLARVVVGRLVILQGLRTTAVQKVDRGARFAARVGGGQRAGEVGSEVDFFAVDFAGGENARDLDADVGHCV